MNRKAKGNRAEYKSIRLLESCGYNCVRSAGSKGLFDVIGISPTDIILCQTKSNRWPSETEMEQIKLFPCPPNTKKLIHKWVDRKSLPIVREIN
jgi:Holliday junction resolvase